MPRSHLHLIRIKFESNANRITMDIDHNCSFGKSLLDIVVFKCKKFCHSNIQKYLAHIFADADLINTYLCVTIVVDELVYGECFTCCYYCYYLYITSF